MKARSVVLSVVLLAVLASDAYCKKEPLVVASKVKAYIKSQKMMTSPNTVQEDGLATKIVELLNGTRILCRTKLNGLFLWLMQIDGRPVDATCESSPKSSPCGGAFPSYEPMSVCEIPVIMDVGYFVQ
jgi:hypothetical protein